MAPRSLLHPSATPSHSFVLHWSRSHNSMRPRSRLPPQDSLRVALHACASLLLAAAAAAVDVRRMGHASGAAGSQQHGGGSWPLDLAVDAEAGRRSRSLAVRDARNAARGVAAAAAVLRWRRAAAASCALPRTMITVAAVDQRNGGGDCFHWTSSNLEARYEHQKYRRRYGSASAAPEVAPQVVIGS